MFLPFHENIYCGYPLEVPHQGASNEYPQHMFSWRNKKKIDLAIPYLERYSLYSWCYLVM